MVPAVAAKAAQDPAMLLEYHLRGKIVLLEAKEAEAQEHRK